MKKLKYLTLILFCLVIAFPIVNQTFEITKYEPSTENRALAKFPKFEAANLNPFPAAFEAWYNDNFRMRSSIMKFFYRLNIFGFNKSPISQEAIIGKDGWYYLSGNNELIMYQGKNRFTGEELDSIRKELEYRQKYLEEKGCKFYFAIVPIKAKIYPEFMPDNIEIENEVDYGQQLMQYLESYSTVKPIDLYESLQKAKKEGRVYHKTDSHMNEYGGMFASQAIMKRIDKDFKKFKYHKPSDFMVDTVVIDGGNVAKMLTISKDVKEYNLKVKLKKGEMAKEAALHNYPCTKGFSYPKSFEIVDETADSTLMDALIIRDSFGAAFKPSLSLCFHRTTYIWDKWEYKLNENIVDGEKPKVFIMLVLESHLKDLLKNHSRTAK